MSKEEYLKGEEKEKILDKIKSCLGFRLNNEEIIAKLKTDGIEISDRTLRRYKKEIKENAGQSAAQIYQYQVTANLVEDVFSYQELQRESWKIYSKSNSSNDQIRALSMVRNVTLDKIKLLQNIPRYYRMQNVDPKKQTKKTFKAPNDFAWWARYPSLTKTRSKQ